MSRTPGRALLACVTLLAAAACTTAQAGTPIPVRGAAPHEPVPSTPPPTSGTTKAANKNPCDLLTADEVGTLGLNHPGVLKQVDRVDTCSWNVSGNGGLAASVEPGLDSLRLEGKRVAPTRYGDHEAVLVEGSFGQDYACSVAIAVSDDIAVLIIANLTASAKDTPAACARATKAAELIEPKLP
ncbi:DUF3558 domain-containing protein [Saccharothrix violaceirubra]|uniref:DUF3558 domain-containing protein n=1 Tax=Saccharothrix violaceirubra TaxID=413306 RepID=A0A7W7T121_9PSEU|nr:DUF3558 family protein [Saccharothrix violaceirubra]MBB4964614.1 hypothetical protein [Saccharothrix violaceirubra]